MSAVEKLRALEWLEKESSHGFNDVSAYLKNALPQIVALVEFSESILGSLPRSHGPTMAQVLRELDEALS